MTTLRKSKSIRFICFSIAIILLYVSCKPSGQPIPHGCSDYNITLSTPSQIAHQFESMLEYIRALEYQEGFTTLEAFHQEIYENSEEATSSITAFEQALNDYQILGFEGYLDTRQDLSDDLKSNLLTYSNDLLTFLSNEQPSLEEFTQFVNDQRTLLVSSHLCPTDKALMSYYLSINQGYAQFYYKHYYDDSKPGIEFRDCSFIGALGCGLIAGVTAVAASLTASLTAIRILLDGSDVTPEQEADLKNLLEAAVLVYVGINTYQWCCGGDEVESQDCELPTGGAIRQVGCGEFTFRIFGSSTYGATEWMNDNTNPSDTITTIPILRFSVPTLGDTSIIKASVTCLKNANTIEVLSFGPEEHIFETNDDLFPLEWVTAPPTAVNYVPNFIIPYAISVNTPSTDQVTYNWTINAPHSINWDAHNAVATVKFKAQGLAKTTVEVVNNCTGEQAILTATTNVQ